MDANVLKLWAKKSDNSNDLYPLIFHMLDTVAVCEEIWGKCPKKRTTIHGKRVGGVIRVCKAVGFFLAGLHDIGKASPGFQSKSDTARQELKKIGVDFEDVKDIPHGIISACVLPELFQATSFHLS